MSLSQSIRVALESHPADLTAYDTLQKVLTTMHHLWTVEPKLAAEHVDVILLFAGSWSLEQFEAADEATESIRLEIAAFLAGEPSTEQEANPATEQIMRLFEQTWLLFWNSDVISFCSRLRAWTPQSQSPDFRWAPIATAVSTMVSMRVLTSSEIESTGWHDPEMRQRIAIDVHSVQWGHLCSGLRRILDGVPREQLQSRLQSEFSLLIRTRKAERQEQIAPQQVAVLETAELPQYVTLDQMAALIQCHKGTISRWIKRDQNAPTAAAEGGGGKPHQFIWSEVRPWLAENSGRQLPDRFPGQKF